MNKMISVIIPVYNAEKYLEKCLKSVINQGNSAVEVIIIDDGSIDNSSDVYNNFQHNNNVVIIKQKNQGVSVARNNAMEKATGKYLMFVDADDYLETNWYECIKDYLSLNDDLILFSENYNNEKYMSVDLQRACLGLSSPFANSYLMLPSSKLYNRNFLLKNKIKFKEKIINGEDMLLNFEILSLTSNVRFVNCGFYYYQKNLSSSTNIFNPQIVESDIQFHHYLQKIIQNNLNYSEWNNDCEKKILLGIFVIVSRYAFSKKTNAECLENLLSAEIYKNVMRNRKLLLQESSLYRKTIYKLLYKRKYSAILCLIKIRNFVRKWLYKFKDNSIIVKI